MKENKELNGVFHNSNFDGLRGLASIVVVFHHLLLTLPWFADRVFLGKLESKGQFNFSIHRIFEYSPLHFFYGGTEAVIIFFVLSGYVLVYAISRERSYDYLRLRAVRLYSPIVFTCALTSTFLILVERKSQLLGSSWLNSHVMKFEFMSLFKNLFVIDGSDGMNSSLWSMRYEILFSMVIAILAGIAFKVSYRKFFTCSLVLVLFISIAMRFNLDIASWLPVFFAGTIIHFLPVQKYFTGIFEAITGLLVMFTPWYFAGLGYSLNSALSRILMTFGAVLIVDACRNQESKLTNFFSSRPLVIAGKYSYSLYLVHAPALTTVWFYFGATESHIGWLFRAGISIVIILICTFTIYIIAEKPSLNWIAKQKIKQN